MLLVPLHIEYIDLLKLNAYKLFEICDADDLSKKKQTCNKITSTEKTEMAE